MEKEMEAQEKRLQVILIRRFIVTLIVVGTVEYILTRISDSLVMPFIADRFFKGRQMSDHFSTFAVGRYIAGSLLGGFISLFTQILPEPVRLPVRAYISSKISGYESSFFLSGQGPVISDLPFASRILLTVLVLALITLLAIPYIVGAARFTIVTMREFRKIAAIRMQMARERERRRNLMIADIAHDLRTPITTISGYAQAITDGLVSGDELTTYLKAIRDKSVGMNDLIQVLFDYTRLDSEGFKLNLEKTDICEIVRECAAALYTDAEKAGMEMEVNIPEKETRVPIDTAQFKRVINNLIVNAIRHNDKGCGIGVFVCEDEGRLMAAVADKGDPIADDIAGHLFDPFFMGDESRNSRGGSGLGLSVAKKITEMHGFSLDLIQGKSLKRHGDLAGYTKAFVITIKKG